MEDVTDWAQIAALYGALADLEPSPVVELNRATAVAFAEGPEAGLRLLEPLRDELDGYQPLHAARAELLRRVGDSGEAARAYERAIGLATDAVEREELERRLVSLRFP
jgi:RNA polymerase sigma-70 factor (ECF subfamily)